MPWLRSELIEDGAGRLACPDDFTVWDEVTLARANADAVREIQENERWPERGRR